ncbi:MAG TPA: PilT/PilU family type 4a pilus ATPase [Kofleriaceae bacterium]|nr:PilT/PilU family type 4a pilus ATPase [Kofleriaceae bacterium]
MSSPTSPSLDVVALPIADVERPVITREQFHRLLEGGVSHGASDIHFRVGDPPTYRVHGKLMHLRMSRLRVDDTRALCDYVVVEPDVRGRLDTLQEHDTSYSIPGVSRFRVNLFRQRGSMSLILRIIPSNIPTIDGLGLPEIVRTIAGYERGLVLVTGATGSGKSSTLAAMINHINQTRRVHILTIEDPIEFLHPNSKASISQRELGIDTKNYNIALRAALRQDPDVILVGEMRDAESVDIALKASETGHMVFSTVHTPDAAKTVSRLVSVFPAEEQQTVRFRLADSLKATVSQRLIPKPDGKGRVAALEVMVATMTIQDYLRDPSRSGSLKTVIEEGRTLHGMQSFDQDLARLVREKRITFEAAQQYATSPTDLERAMRFD